MVLRSNPTESIRLTSARAACTALQVQFTYLNPMPRDVVMTTRYSINEDDIVLVLRGPAEASPNFSSASYVARAESRL